MRSCRLETGDPDFHFKLPFKIGPSFFRAVYFVLAPHYQSLSVHLCHSRHTYTHTNTHTQTSPSQRQRFSDLLPILKGSIAMSTSRNLAEDYFSMTRPTRDGGLSPYQSSTMTPYSNGSNSGNSIPNGLEPTL